MVLKFILAGIALVFVLGETSGLFKKAQAEAESPTLTVQPETNVTIVQQPPTEQAEKTEVIGDRIIIIERDAPTDTSTKTVSTQPVIISNRSFLQAQEDRLQLEKELSTKFPLATASTSLAGSKFVRGEQIKRSTGFEGSQITDLEEKIQTGKVELTPFTQKLLDEQKRAEATFLALFGTTANPDFGK